MKIEEIKTDIGIKIDTKLKPINKNPKKNSDTFWKEYWFPIPKGYNRILIIFAILVIVYTVYKYPEKVSTFFFTIMVEAITYVAIIWIYRGFKELPPKNET